MRKAQNAAIKTPNSLRCTRGGPAIRRAEAVFPGDSTSGTYHDYMKTVYASGIPENIQLPLTSFDAEFNLHGLGAESWMQSEDGRTWTFQLREGLKFSDGHPLTAEDYVFALQRAATSGYDFAWYWDFAGGIEGWNAVTSGDAEVDTLGIRAVDDLTIEVTTARHGHSCRAWSASGTGAQACMGRAWRRLRR